MPRGLADKTYTLIQACIRILEAIQPATVRAVCYKLFTAGLIPDMSPRSTKRVSATLVTARERNLIDWRWVVDETRREECVATWDNPGEVLEAVAHQYRKDRWARQPSRVEVWSEKGSVRGTLAPVLHAYAVPLRVLHGGAVDPGAERERGGDELGLETGARR